VVVGETRGWLGQSLWLREVAGREEGAPPPVDLAAERRNGDFVRGEILAGPKGAKVRACHDAADGGLLVALTEMCMASGVGAEITRAGDHEFWFGEDQGRYILAVEDGAALLAAAAAAGVPAERLGQSSGRHLVMPGADAIDIAELAEAHEATLPALMQGV
jgi:phosphoribosylformylglycinamidine synthase subunit PurL